MKASLRTPLFLLVALLAFVGGAASYTVQAATLPLTPLRSTSAQTGAAVDPATGKFYERSTFDGPAVVRVYNDAVAFEAGTAASVITPNPRGYGTYFAAQDGRFFGRSTSGGWYGEAATRETEVRGWNGTTGVGELILPNVPGMGGLNSTHTFNWGGFTGVNVLNDNGQMYILGQRSDLAGFLLVKLNPDLTIASSRLLVMPATQGFAFIVRGKLFIGSSYKLPGIQRMVDVATGQITPVSHTFSGPSTWYLTNSFYDAASDRLYVYNFGTGLNRVDNAASILGVAVSPVANAGLDQTVPEGATVTLSAENSYDGNTPALPLTFSWTQLSGVPVALANPDSAVATFSAPQVPASGAVLEFQVTVSNGISNPVTDTVTVSIGNVNFPPVANAGSPQIVSEGAKVTLQGTGTDADGDTLTLSWTQKSGPPVELIDADAAQPSFVAPSVSYEAGSVELVFTLIVNDGLVNSGPSDVSVEVLNTNAPPVANAGPSQSVNELQAVSLDGSQSSDPDGDPLTYVWTQIAGEPLVTLSGANTLTPTFTAPLLDLGGSAEGTTLTFQLTVSDGELSRASTVNVRVSNVNHLPIADAGEDKTVPENTVVALDGSGSADTDGDALAYLWEQIDTGYPVVLSNPAAESPTFIAPDVNAGGAVLQFKLTVDDGYGGTNSAVVSINVTYANRAPVADAGPDGSVDEGSTVLVTGAGSDPDGNPLEYRWTQVSGPAVAFNNAFVLTPTFTAPSVPRAGDTLVLRLTVADPYGAEHSDDVAIAVSNVNRAPLANAPANLTLPEEAAVNLIGQGTDPDTEEQGELVYQWQQIAPTVEPASAGNALSFIAPTLSGTGSGDVSLTLTLRFTVTDPNGASASEDVNVVVTNTPKAPTAVASAPELVDEATSVTLNASASTDPDGDVLSFSWVQTFGPPVTLSEANTAHPFFTAPFVNAEGALVKFQVTVDDGFGGSSSDEVTVSVQNINDAPIVETARASIEAIWPPDHRLVEVSILDVIDPNANATVTITGVTQDEPTSGDAGGDVPVDAIISANGSSVLLRSERSPSGDGRVYRITFVAADFEHSVTGVVKVSVAKTKRFVAVEGPLVIDSTK